MEKGSINDEAKAKVDKQNWLVLQIVGPGLRQQTKDTAIRTLGAFNTEEEANEYAKNYSKLDDTFDTFVLKMYWFSTIPTEVHDVGEIKYQEPKLNDLMKVHEESRTQTEDWNRRIENAHKAGKSGSMMNL